jgi:hypothetical protein
MFRQLIPFYREDRNEDQGYTLFIDRKSGRIYKAYHRKVNQLVYWIATVLTLALLREIKDIHFYVNHPILIFLLIACEITVSLFIGYYGYKMYFNHRLKEIYITKEMLEDYQYKGRRVLKKDTIIAICLFAAFVLSIVLFLITYWFIWLLASFYLSALMSYLLCFFSKERYKMCRND